MTTEESIKKLGEMLKRGDQQRIAKKVGVHQVAISRFFRGDDCVSEDTAMDIIDAAEIVIKERNKRKDRLNRKIESITKIA